MARLFGLIAKQPVDLTITLPERYKAQALTHGWGLGWYENKKPLTQKQKRSSISHDTNEGLDTSVNSTIAIMHMRQATSGAVSDENIHPFTYQNYLFAHTGSVNKDLLMSKLHSPFSENFQSEPVDSEVLFRYLVQSIGENGAIEGLKIALSQVQSIIGATFLLSDGETLYCYRKAQPLYWLSWKAGEPFNALAQSTGVALTSNALSAQRGIILSSEKINNGNWMIMDDDELFIVNKMLDYQTIKIH